MPSAARWFAVAAWWARISLSWMDSIRPSPSIWSGNPERKIALGEFSFEIGLHDRAIRDRRVILDAANDPELMHATVARAVRLVLEAHFANGPVLLLERRDRVLLAEAVRDQPEHRIFRAATPLPARIGDEEAAGAAERRLRMAGEALVRVVARAQPIGIRVELGKDRIEFA